MSTYPIVWKCPHCGTQNTRSSVEVPYWFGGKALEVCDIEVGGCDKAVVVNVEVKVYANAHKIEGLE